MTAPSRSRSVDLGVDDVRDARGHLVRVTAPALLGPLDGALGLLELARVELAHEVLGEPAIEGEDRDEPDRDDQADVAREELRAERHRHRDLLSRSCGGRDGVA